MLVIVEEAFDTVQLIIKIGANYKKDASSPKNKFVMKALARK